jgi:hypothetical protein
MECKGRPKWRDAPLTKKAPYKPDAPNAPVRFDEGGVETGTMARLLRHRQTKEAETDRPGLTSTAPHSYSTVKPLRAGMPGDSGVLVVTRVRSTNTKCTRGRGCNGHPAFPTPSKGRKINARLGRIAPRDREVMFGIGADIVIPGRCEASNPESRDSGSGPADHPGMTVLTASPKFSPINRTSI